MNKTYTLENTQLTETAKHAAILNYHLIDDKGNKRVVPAVAQLGFGKKIKSVSARYYRETPLVAVLSQAKLQQKVEVSYTKFNKQPRISLLSAGRKVAADAVDHNDFNHSESYANDNSFKHIIPAPSILTLGLFTISAFMLWMLTTLVSAV